MSTAPAEVPATEREPLPRTIGRLAAIIASEDFPTGDRAALKRLTPGVEPPLAFYRFAFRHLEDGWPARKGVWMTICAGIALMCPSPHRPDRPVGQALAEVRYSEARLQRLLDAEGEVLQTLVLRAARFLAAKGEAVNWADFARLLLTEDPAKREDVHLRLARDYYRHQPKD